MAKTDKRARVLRRTFLAGASATLAAAVLRPLFAAAETGSPKRLLLVHRPCGTRLEQWFPATGGVKDFEITPLLEPLAGLREEMVILNQVHCPRDPSWPGDHHGAGMITMTVARRPIIMPGTSDTGDPTAKNYVGADLSIDQLLAQKAPTLQGTAVPSLQLTAYRPSSTGLPVHRVMSYGGRAAPLFPESRPDVAFANVFGSLTPSGNQDPAALTRLRQQDKSVLDYLAKDMSRLYAQAPAAQRPKLDAHLAAIRSLEMDLAQGGAAPGQSCSSKPTLTPLPDPTGDLSADEAQHEMVSRQQLQIIKAAFLCDVTRVATFSFAHGNSFIRFQKILKDFPNDSAGHHDISHEGSAVAISAQAAADKYYSERMAELLNDMKATPEGTGTMLDNTLVVYFSEVSIGADHNHQNMPVLMFGAKSLGLNRSSHLKYGGRYMSDVWAATATAFGVPMQTFGDAQWNKGPAPDLFI
jgi:Protein of unknown function (DUF1552)